MNKTIVSTSVTPKAHAIAVKEAKRRKSTGIPSSITAVISEAIIKNYSKNFKEDRNV